MGADEKSIFKKCGEILINIKAKNKKNKIYTFNCAFCDVNCDQLKKFSLHLDEKHLQQFSEEESEDKTVMYVPEIKDEEIKNTETNDELQSIVCLPLYEDPLETIDPVAKEIQSAEMLIDMEIKEEEAKEPNFEMDYEDNDFNRDDIDYQDCPEDNDDNYSGSESSGSEYKVKRKTKQLSKLRKRKKVKLSEKKKEIKSTSEQAKKRLKKYKENAPEIDEKELSIALLKAFEKQTILWKVKERVLYNKNIQKYFEVVANEVNEKMKSNLTWETAKMRIRKMRHHYSQEILKKNKGEDYKLPWYSEHMEFLQENVQVLLKGRQHVRKYKPLKNGIKSKRNDDTSVTAKKHLKKSEENALDINEKELSIALLEAFEKQTILWKVKERTKFNSVSQKYFEIVANEVNAKLKSNLTWATAKMHIRKMHKQYSEEIQKKKKGEDYDLPWYSDHMDFLQENVEVLLKGRRGVKRYYPLKTMDETQLSILIDVYKKYDSLWQVNNIEFGSRSKKEEVFQKVTDELNSNHNFNITADSLHPRINYMLRIYSENKQLQLKCELENLKFEPSTPLYEKMAFLSECQGPYKCAQCNEIINKKYGDYREHVAKHNNSVPFTCPICERSFDKYWYYLSHARRHMEINSHICKFCDKDFHTATELKLHERLHTGEYPYLCQICGATFRTPHGYDNHIRRHENRFRYVCHICNHGFNLSHALNDHVKSHLNIRDIVCNVCGKSFISTKRLRNHQDIHAEHKRFKCKDCGKEFAQNAGLRQHRKQHKPFSALHKEILN